MVEKNEHGQPPLIIISLPEDASVTLGPQFGSRELDFHFKDVFTIYPLSKQDLRRSKFIKLGFIEDGEEKQKPVECYLPIKAGEEESLEEALKKFEKIMGVDHPLAVDSVWLDIYSRLQSALFKPVIKGPDLLTALTVETPESR